MDMLHEDQNARRSPAAARAALFGMIGMSFAILSASPLAANPAIANNPPCNSGRIAFRPTASNEQQALAFARSLTGVRRIEKGADGGYIAELGGADEVNALIANLNQRHAAQVIDLFQFFQCKYKLF